MKPASAATLSGATVAELCCPEIVADGQSWGVTMQCSAWWDPSAPYRLAMSISEEFPELAKNGRVRIVTVVANAQIAEQTRTGIFDYLEANRSFPTMQLLRHFRQDGTTWVATRSLREMLDVRISSSATTPTTGPLAVGALRPPSPRCAPGAQGPTGSPGSPGPTPTPTPDVLSRESLRQSTESVLARLFGPTVEVRPSGHSFSDAGAIVVVGARTETVVVRVARSLLTAYASSLLRVDEADVGDTDRSDALLELVDVLGGVVRTAMPGDATLTVPYDIAMSLVDRDAATAANVVSFSTAKGLLSILTVCGSVCGSVEN